MISLTCKNCGSHDLHRDAWAAWDEKTGTWELGDIYDEEIWCSNCETEGHRNVTEVIS